MMHPQISQETQRWVLKWNNMKRKSWGTLLNSQHFGGRRACWSSKMGLGWTHKQELKMMSTCTTKKRRRLMQVEWKWCDEFSRDNFKHKFYTTHNHWAEAPLPLYSILYAFLRRLHPNVTFPWDSCCPKTLDVHIFFKWNFFENVREYFISLEKILPKKITLPNQSSFDPCFQGICGQESNSQFDSYSFFWSQSMQIKSKWIIRGHFKHLRFKTFLMVS